MSGMLAAVCAVLVLASLWELLGARGEAGGRLWRRLAAAGPAEGDSSRLPRGSRTRLAESGYAARIGYAQLLLAKAAVAAAAGIPGAAIAGIFPARMHVVIAVGVPLAAFWGPDLLLVRAARLRRTAMLAELPAALDLMATGAASGRGINALLADAMTHTRGPLREELARTVTAIECGTSQAEAIEALRARGSGTRLGAVAAALERSRRHGSPLARALHEQAASLREDQRRELGEAAARAAPKMQLAVALILVPSVLLIVAAAIVANAGSLLPGWG